MSRSRRVPFAYPALPIAILVCIATGRAQPERDALQHEPIHQALGLLQYIRGDYALAVAQDGSILDADEYDEQVEFVEEVRGLVRREADRDARRARGLERRLRDLERLVTTRAAPGPVQSAVQSLQVDLVRMYDLQLAPGEPPDLRRGAQVYVQACAACHGADGRGQTAIAARLVPSPPDLLAASLDETLSPYQVFNRVTFGVPGTAMPSFETLARDERWDAAFYLLAMRRAYPDAGAAPCVTVSSWDSHRERPPVAALARLTDRELEEWLSASGVQHECLGVLIAELRQSPAPSP